MWYFPRWSIVLSSTVALALVAWGIGHPQPRREIQPRYYSYEGGDVPQNFVEHPTPDERIADYTHGLEVLNFLLVLVGAGTVFAILRQVNWMEHTDRRIAQQIELATNEFLASHRPRLVLRSVMFDGNTNEPNPVEPRVKVEFANVEGIGDISVTAKLAFGIFRTGKLVPWKMAEALDNVDATSIIAPYGGSAAIITTMPPERAADFNVEAITSGVSSIYCIGYVVYADASGVHAYRLGFVRRLDIENRWFETINFPDFSYTD